MKMKYFIITYFVVILIHEFIYYLIYETPLKLTSLVLIYMVLLSFFISSCIANFKDKE